MSGKLGVLAFLLGMLAFQLMAQESTPQQQAEVVYNLHISKMDAASALNQLAHQTDSVIVYSFQQARQHQANAIYGYFSLADALKYLLQNSGLKAEYIRDQGIRISLEQQPSDSAAVLTEDNDEPASVQVETIEVAGIRKSMLKAQDIKRQSDAILDVIVAEDIGKLPDITAAESLARLPGVQVTRYNDEATDILIRGLPYHATTYNSREIYTAELRRMQLQDMPSQMLARIEVYKPGTVNVVEPGLAGIVNAVTRKPFDFPGEKIGGGLHINYNDQSDKLNPNANLLYSNRWRTDMGEMGFLVNLSYAAYQYHNGVRYASPWYAGGNAATLITPAAFADGNFFFPAKIGLYNSGGERERPALNFAFQWQPNSELEVYADGIYQGYRSKDFSDNFDISLDWRDERFEPLTYDNITLVEGTTNQVKHLTRSGGYPPQGYRANSAGATNTAQLAVGGIWSRDAWRIQSDIAYTNTHYSNEVWSVDFVLAQPYSVDVDFNTDGGVVFAIPDFDITDVSQYRWRGYYENKFRSEGSGLQWRTDFSYLTPWHMVHTLKLGVRVTTRNAGIQSGTRYMDTSALDLPYGELPIGPLSLFDNPIRSSQQSFSQYLVASRDNIVANSETMRQLTLDAIDTLIARYPARSDLLDRRNEFSSDKVQYDPDTLFSADEYTLAMYLQAGYEFTLGHIEIDGVAGLRAVGINREARGTSTIYTNENKEEAPNTATDNYYDVLPAFNARARLSSDLYLRLGYAQTLTPQNFSLLNPALNITQINNGVIDHSSETIEAYGSSGNPELEPLTSSNYDVSLEYYYSDTGFVAGTGFYRKLNGFAASYRQIVEDPVYGTIELNRPQNADDGKIYGYELNAQTLLGFLGNTWENVGIKANTTYLRGYFRQLLDDGSLSDYADLEGLSTWTYNFATFYENKGFSLRLSYNYRSPWINWYLNNNTSGPFAGSRTRARERLDFSMSYDIDKRYRLYADIRNLTAKPFRNYVQINESQSYPIDVRDEGRYFGIGLNVLY